jgi:hypothetical protein
MPLGQDDPKTGRGWRVIFSACTASGSDSTASFQHRGKDFFFSTKSLHSAPDLHPPSKAAQAPVVLKWFEVTDRDIILQKSARDWRQDLGQNLATALIVGSDSTALA